MAKARGGKGGEGEERGRTCVIVTFGVKETTQQDPGTPHRTPYPPQHSRSQTTPTTPHNAMNGIKAAPEPPRTPPELRPSPAFSASYKKLATTPTATFFILPKP